MPAPVINSTADHWNETASGGSAPSNRTTTVPSGTDRVAVAFFMAGNLGAAFSINTATLGGQSMTRVTGTEDSTNAHLDIFYLLDADFPSTGSQTLACTATASGNNRIIYGVVYITGARQEAPYLAGSDSGQKTAHSVTINSIDADSLALEILAVVGSGVDLNPNSGQTEAFEDQRNQLDGAVAYETLTAGGNVTFDYGNSGGGDDDAIYRVLVFRAPAGGTTTLNAVVADQARSDAQAAMERAVAALVTESHTATTAAIASRNALLQAALSGDVTADAALRITRLAEGIASARAGDVVSATLALGARVQADGGNAVDRAEAELDRLLQAADGSDTSAAGNASITLLATAAAGGSTSALAALNVIRQAQAQATTTSSDAATLALMAMGDLSVREALESDIQATLQVTALIGASESGDVGSTAVLQVARQMAAVSNAEVDLTATLQRLAGISVADSSRTSTTASIFTGTSLQVRESLGVGSTAQPNITRLVNAALRGDVTALGGLTRMARIEAADALRATIAAALTLETANQLSVLAHAEFGDAATLMIERLAQAADMSEAEQLAAAMITRLMTVGESSVSTARASIGASVVESLAARATSTAGQSALASVLRYAAASSTATSTQAAALTLARMLNAHAQVESGDAVLITVQLDWQTSDPLLEFAAAPSVFTFTAAARQFVFEPVASQHVFTLP